MNDRHPDSDGAPRPPSDEMFEDAPCALLSTSVDGTISWANRTFIAWLGFPPEDVLGARFQKFLTVGSRIYYETHYSPLLQIQGVVNEIALEMRRADGQVRPVVASARQARAAGGAVVEHHVALFDSTDRRGYEKEILQARKDADQTARVLGAEATRKNEFIALLAHELRNPLAPIRGAVDILRRSGHRSELLDRVSAILNRQVSQMTRLVDDLLDVSRLGQGKLDLQRVPVDLSSVIHQAVEVSAPLLEAAGIELRLVLPTSPIYIQADAQRLAQVFGNLLNNAAKFTPRGGHVALFVQRENADVVIQIRDTGSGIAPEHLPIIFDLFAQGVSSSRRKDGLGIGLTLAKTLVERHDGRIAVASGGIGQGAEFTITMPVLVDAPMSVSRAFGPVRDDAVTPKRRILVVDDNADSADAIALLLGFAGHEVRTAHDGPEALEVVDSFLPDLILLDLGLPGLSGYEVAQRVLAGSPTPPKLVALTGWGQDDDRIRTSAAGFVGHLVKPVDHDDLLALVATLSADLAP